MDSKAWLFHSLAFSAMLNLSHLHECLHYKRNLWTINPSFGYNIPNPSEPKQRGTCLSSKQIRAVSPQKCNHHFLPLVHFSPWKTNWVTPLKRLDKNDPQTKASRVSTDTKKPKPTSHSKHHWPNYAIVLPLHNTHCSNSLINGWEMMFWPWIPSVLFKVLLVFKSCHDWNLNQELPRCFLTHYRC